jgi:hypothetical protein
VGALPGAARIPADDVEATAAEAVVPGAVAHDRRDPGHARPAEVHEQRADPLSRPAGRLAGWRMTANVIVGPSG